ncbi:glycosyltransferase family 2 protein [Neotamlana laminarinivorans]|uniref:Glycosyltransferase family 2 protein n=1 Tax=Neotamlana laminarinivorans TaxID=2883124 RepID=A0A9X1L5L1_9FLAO|nr:glycosyltransferase family 2 protein [Tamlana laminarinivorans]MCB4799526.1 glycosyltransferase family 2 protein [Tamlana laminarinivorans]
MIPLISVVIPLYNKAKYIEDTLKSVINQTFKNFEIIIINDGSTDDSVEAAKRINDSRITIYNQTNLGLSQARNNGIKKGRAKYIAFIDADDLWLPNHLEQLFELIKKYPNRGLYCTGYSIKKSDTICTRASFNGLPKNFKGIIPNFFKNSLHHCVAWIGAICIPKFVFEDIGYFDTDIYSEQDTDMYIKIALKYEVVLDNSYCSAIYNRTIDDNMYSFSNKKKIPKLLYSYKEIESTNNDLKKYIDINRFSTIIFFKLSLNKKLEKALIKDVDFSNLNTLQQMLILLPNSIVQILFRIKNKLKLNTLIVFKQ